MFAADLPGLVEGRDTGFRTALLRLETWRRTNSKFKKLIQSVGSNREVLTAKMFIRTISVSSTGGWADLVRLRLGRVFRRDIVGF